MKKMLILMLTLIIVLSSVAMISVSASDDSNAKLGDLSLPKTWIDRNISEVNGSSSLVAFSQNHSLEFGVDFNTNIDSKNLTEVDRNLYQDGNTLLEVVNIDGKDYHVFVKCNGTNNISSQPEILQEANYELFKFNKLNDCNPIEIS
ncbi:hypothetical protein TL18_05965 [Methanobrevibacter sp. YE315]|uniref:hypothetical protein n=1 Tax=Methanobrevibacter sp. YE315 TaxID=1609968 RepID=UPI000764E459|nr:hypothetical protein [Methanobrevibacter sp. YE315]AMD17603.1 hypothetical protein TL18_05965 [Methanobrevibacter sp. YE315]